MARLRFHETLESPRCRWFSYEGVQPTEVEVSTVGEERRLKFVLLGL